MKANKQQCFNNEIEMEIYADKIGKSKSENFFPFFLLCEYIQQLKSDMLKA